MRKFKLIIAINITIIMLTFLLNRTFASEMSTKNSEKNINNNLITGNSGMELLLGDLNNDSIVDTNDIVIMLRHITSYKTKEHTEWLLKDEFFKAADLTGDGVVDDDDSLKLLRYVSAKNNPQIAEEHPEWLELKVGKNEEVEISNVYLNKTETILNVGDIEQLVAVIVPTSAKDAGLVWESSNNEVVEVNESGTIIGKNIGTAIVSVKTKNNKGFECLVKVEEKLNIVETQQIPATVSSMLIGGQSENVVIDGSASTEQQNIFLTEQQQQEILAQQQQEVLQQQQAIELAQQQQAIEAAQQQQAIEAAQQQQAIETAQQQQAVETAQQALEAAQQQESVIEQQRRIIAEQQQALLNPTPSVTPTPTAMPTPTVEPTITPAPEIQAAGIAIEGAQTLDISGMKSKKLTYTIRPSKTTNKTVTWSSSDPSVVEVNSSTGEITAKKNGEAIITVTTVNNKKGTCKIKVITTCTDVSISRSRNDLLIGTTLQLGATVAPETATNKDLKWTSSNNAIATVDGYGKVTARGNGTATITATTVDGSNKSASLTIDVGTYPTRVTLNKSSAQLELGEKLKLTATISPPIKNLSPGYDRVTWESSNNNVAIVSSDGEITAKGEGTATITAKTKNNISASCEVSIDATKISLDRTILMIDNTHYNIADLKATLTSKALYNGKNITWSIDNPGIVKFQKDGKKHSKITGTENAQIVGLKFGTATLTVSIPNGKKATCKIKVITSSKENTGKDRRVDWDHGGTIFTFFLRKGTWGNKYVEAYVNNAAKIVKKYQNSKFKDEAAERIVWTYRQKSVVINADKKAKRILSTSGPQYGNTVTPRYNSDFEEKAMKRKKGELSPNNYLLLFTSKNEWAYLFNKNKSGEWKLICSKEAAAGYCRDEFEKYLSLFRRSGFLDLELSYMDCSRDQTTYQNSVHKDIGSIQGEPQSGGCIRIAYPDQEMYYRIYVEAGVGTRLILF